MIIWYALGACTSVLIAWIAALVHASGHAPLGLTSLAVGIALGAALIRIAATLRLAGRNRLIFGAVLLALLTIVAEHAWLYLDFRRQWQEAMIARPQAALFRTTPPSPIQYFSHELTLNTAFLWTIDAVLIVVSATLTVYFLLSTHPNSQSEIRNPQSSDTRHPTPDN